MIQMLIRTDWRRVLINQILRVILTVLKNKKKIKTKYYTRILLLKGFMRHYNNKDKQKLIILETSNWIFCH